MKFLANIAPKFFHSRDLAPQSSGARLGRQAQLPVNPGFEAIDPSIRPVAASRPSAEIMLVFPKNRGRKAQVEDEKTVAGHWAY